MTLSAWPRHAASLSRVSTDRRYSASPRVAMSAAMFVAMQRMQALPACSATMLLACQGRASTLAVMSAQVARRRWAVDWILSPPSVHSYKLHCRL
jgi:hypothetical protein